MRKLIITILFGGSIISGLWTYYKTDDPIEATNVFMEKAGKTCEDIWIAVKHFFSEIVK